MRDVVESHQKIFEKVSRGGRILPVVVLVVTLFLAGCNGGKGGLETFCSELPTAQAELTSFQTEVASYIPSKTSGKPAPGRRIASVAAAAAPAPSEESKALWLDWTERSLKKTQWARDSLGSESKGRKALAPLNDASFSLVSIHGYLVQSKWKKAVNELEKVDRDLARAYEVACKTKPTTGTKKSLK